MSRSAINFNDYVSLAVMLLMVVALVTGQTDASADEAKSIIPIVDIAALDALGDNSNIHLQGYFKDQAVKLSIDIAADLSQFRGEDE